MPELFARILFLFLIFSLIKSWWDQSGGKDNPLLDRLRVLLLISLLFLAFFRARHTSRSGDFWLDSFLL
jgi:hypothetical protein